MRVKTCRRCGAVLFEWFEETRPLEVSAFRLGGSFCGCPNRAGKYRERTVSDGVLVVFGDDPHLGFPGTFDVGAYSVFVASNEENGNAR